MIGPPVVPNQTLLDRDAQNDQPCFGEDQGKDSTDDRIDPKAHQADVEQGEDQSFRRPQQTDAEDVVQQHAAQKKRKPGRTVLAILVFE